MASRIAQILWAGFLFVVAAIGVIIGLWGFVDLVQGDVVRVSLLGEIGVGFGVGCAAGIVAVGYLRSAFTRPHPPGAA